MRYFEYAKCEFLIGNAPNQILIFVLDGHNMMTYLRIITEKLLVLNVLTSCRTGCAWKLHNSPPGDT